MPFRK